MTCAPPVRPPSEPLLMSRFVLALASLGALAGLACRDTQTPLQPSPVSAQASGATFYEAINLGTLGGPSSYPNAINDSGQVVGWSSTASEVRHAFLWENGAMRDLGSLHEGDPEDFSTADAINNSGLVAGVGYESGSGDRLVVWENGVILDLGIQGGLTAEVEAMNARGEVVVPPARSEGSSPRAGLRRHPAGMVPGLLLPDEGTYAVDGNNQDPVARRSNA